MNEVIGAQVVSVPTDVPLARADAAFRTFIVSLTGVFAFIFIALNLMLYFGVIRRVTRLSRLADEVSLGKFDGADFSVALARRDRQRSPQSLSRMKKSLVQAMKMLEE